MGSRPANALSNIKEVNNLALIDSFLWFVHERENIRLKKNNGSSHPWTSDPILKHYKFTNIRRECDALSKIIQNLYAPIKDKPEQLLMNCMIASHIINAATLTHLGIIPLKPNSKEYIFKIRELNVKFGTAYQCPAQYKTILGYKTREDMLFIHIPKISNDAMMLLSRDKSILEVVDEINLLFGFKNTFLNMQALLQLSEINCNLVDASSETPIGVGAIPALKALFPNEKPRDSLKTLCKNDQLLKICGTWANIEHALCEWRKWVELSTGIREPRSNLLYKKKSQGF